MDGVLAHVGDCAGRVLDERPAARDPTSAVQSLWKAYRVEPLRSYLGLAGRYVAGLCQAGGILAARFKA